MEARDDVSGQVSVPILVHGFLTGSRFGGRAGGQDRCPVYVSFRWVWLRNYASRDVLRFRHHVIEDRAQVTDSGERSSYKFIRLLHASNGRTLMQKELFKNGHIVVGFVTNLLKARPRLTRHHLLLRQGTAEPHVTI